ncbi:MAG TPA: PDZ domain-containing protein [Thermoanaerobaculia bacterium]|jgi:hypothetical protein|nr:PDZ domain-containing protein [Thermoanaerobaculia bacterium]
MKVLRALLLLLVSVVGGSLESQAAAKDALAPFKPAETKIEGEVVLPARRLGDLLVVEAGVDGRGPFSFILDTGAGAVFVSPEVAGGSGKGKGAAVYSKEKGGDRQIGREVSIGSLTLGGAEFKKFRALSVDLADLHAATGERIDGLLGFSLFAGVLFTLDFPNGRVVLRQGKLPAANGEDILSYSLEPGGTPQVVIQIGDASVPAVVDSGQSDALSVPKNKGFAFKKGPAEGPLAASLTGRKRREMGRLAGSVHLGRYIFDTPAAVEEGSTTKIGAGILKDFAVGFDPAARTVRFEHMGESAIVVPSPRTVGLGFIRKAGGWEVVDVIPGTSAASAGVQVGDVLLAVNGRSVSELSYNAWLSLLQSESSLSIDLRRGENRTQLSLPVGELVR